MQPWHVEDPGGQLDVVLTPRFDKHSHVEAGRSGARPIRCSARGPAGCVTDDGLALELDGLQGFAEEARQHW